MVEAERMRQYENILDQQAAKSKSANLNQAFDDLTKSLVHKRQPEVTPENLSNDAITLEDVQESSKLQKLAVEALDQQKACQIAKTSSVEPNSNATVALHASAEPNFLNKDIDAEKNTV